MKNITSYHEYHAWLQPQTYRLGHTVRLKFSPDVSHTARQECAAGIERLFGQQSLDDNASFCISLSVNSALPREGYRIGKEQNGLLLEGADDHGILYGVFALLRLLAQGQHLSDISAQSAPAVGHRVLNHWDRSDGSIERGYAGNSIFFKNGEPCYDPARIRDYARLLCSVGINEIAVNNVNVSREDAKLLELRQLKRLGALADIFRPYGIRLILSISFDSPIHIDGLLTSDPLDEQVAQWWREKTRQVYDCIPDLVGFLVKVDSEFQGGPAAHGRTQAQGANMLARAVEPYGGLVYWRCFIYNCMQDWRDTVTDRPKAPYELFKPLDGQFDDNIILQIKNGPSDFQVREPNSPLFGALEHTRMALELQITQEYTGQQVDLYNLAVQWEEVLAFPISSDKSLAQLIGGPVKAVAAVSNVGDDKNWTGHTLAQANLYAFGRLAWDPFLTAKQITGEWVRLTFGLEPTVVNGVTDIMLRSRAVYEKYTATLGLGWMVNVGHHYGPSPEGYEYMNWGTYHRANHTAVGIDRTRSGTGFTAQYPKSLAEKFENLKTCPEELLLYFHRLPYDYLLKHGKTLLQHIYDTHFTGADEVEQFLRLWDLLQAHLPQETYRSVRERLCRQLKNAQEWRDVINTYFYRFTGVPDEQGRKIYE